MGSDDHWPAYVVIVATVNHWFCQKMTGVFCQFFFSFVAAGTHLKRVPAATNEKGSDKILQRSQLSSHSAISICLIFFFAKAGPYSPTVVHSPNSVAGFI